MRAMSDPLRSLADAARAVTAAATDDDVLAIVAAAAREITGAPHATARRGEAPGAPLIARDGSTLGAIELDGKELTSDDEAVVAQLALMAANAIETIALLREKQRAEALQRVGSAIASRLELQEIVQIATDSARELTPAAFGAFFYNVIRDAGEAYMLYTLSGVERSAFERFPMPRNTDDLLADVQRRGHRPARRRPAGPPLRPQRHLSRDAARAICRSAATSRSRS